MINIKLYKIRLKTDDGIDGYYYGGQRRFHKEGKYYTRKQLSTHLGWAHKTAKHFLNGIIEIIEYKVEEQAVLRIDNLKDFKLIEQREKSLSDILDENENENEKDN